MNLRGYGITRSQLRQGSQGPGGGNGDDHFEDMLGSRDLFIYLAPNRKLKGYAELKAYLEQQGCQLQPANNAPLLPGKGYQAIKITLPGELIPNLALRKAHRWAHQRNFLHSFFKPSPKAL
jgi:hypothetical protein